MFEGASPMKNIPCRCLNAYQLTRIPYMLCNHYLKCSAFSSELYMDIGMFKQSLLLIVLLTPLLGQHDL
jgi:hypothetical protein